MDIFLISAGRDAQIKRVGNCKSKKILKIIKILNEKVFSEIWNKL